jgi:hypothetical protein
MVAGGKTLGTLEEQVLASGVEPQQVVRELIADPEDDSLAGGNKSL